jgi:transposase
VKAYVKRNKNDAADAEAICEAVRRPTMRFVRVKSAEQQGQLMQHRTRDLLMRQRTQVINALRAHVDGSSCDSSTTITLRHFGAGERAPSTTSHPDSCSAANNVHRP